MNKEFIYGYDVNSLFPYVMESTELPCGKVTYFIGDIYKQQDKIDMKPNGFFFCEVTAPDNLKHPILQYRMKNGTVSSLGYGKGVFYSKEIENAMKLGYKFKVICGYNFSLSVRLFKSYVQDLHKMRVEYESSHPMNLIAKLLMNSLYGRFGLDTSHGELTLYNENDYNKLILNMKENHKIIDVMQIDLDSGIYYLVEEKFEDIHHLLGSKQSFSNSCIAIAAAITAESRIFMGGIQK